MTRLLNAALVLAVAILGAPSVGAQEKRPGDAKAAPATKAPAEAKAASAGKKGAKESVTTAIVGATVLPVTRGMIRRGTVIWKDGKIVEVGSEIDVPDGAKIVDGNGLFVCPGFVSIVSTGVGVGSTRGNVKDSLDPYNRNLRIALACGITTTQLLDQRFGSFFGGESPIGSGSNSAILKTTYGDLGSMLLREPAFNYFSLPSRQLEVNYFNLRDRFRRAKEYIKQRDEAAAKKAKPPRMSRELGTYVKLLENKTPTVVSPRNNQEVEIILALSAEHGFDIILNEPNDAWQIAPTLAARKVPVLVKSRGRDFDFSTGGKTLETGDMAPVRRPAAFADAGVEVAILPYKRGIDLGGLAGRDLTTLALDAAFAVRGGMSEEKALAAITIVPARLLGISDRVGSLEAGKDADLLLLSGHPLDYRSFVLESYINGKLYYEREKSRLFRRIPLSSEK